MFRREFCVFSSVFSPVRAILCTAIVCVLCVPVNVYLKAHLLAVILRLELDFGAMCIVHAYRAIQ